MEEQPNCSLAGLDPLYGRQICSMREGSYWRLDMVIPAARDLILSHEVEISLLLPEEYVQDGNGPIVVRTEAPHLFENTYAVVRRNVLEFPWLSAPSGTSTLFAGKQSLFVWFHTIRGALQHQAIEWSWKEVPCIVHSRIFSSPLPAVDGPKAASNLLSNPQHVSLLTASGSTKGRRPYMEDVDCRYRDLRASVALQSKGNQNIPLLLQCVGVMDGHGGADCAQFMSEEIVLHLSKLLKSFAATTTAASEPAEELHECIRNCLYKSFVDADVEYLKISRTNAGCTCCMALYNESTNTMYVANTGDTRAVLCRSGTAINLTRDHKSSCPIEVARILRMGGYVLNGRVNGSLAVARALGDRLLKTSKNRNGKSENNSSNGNGDGSKIAEGAAANVNNAVLIGNPEITSFRPAIVHCRGEELVDEFLILASDGLWDVLSSQEAVNLTRAYLRDEGLLNGSYPIRESPEAVSKKLTSIAQKIATDAVQTLGSLDNVTVILVLLQYGLPNGEPSCVHPWEVRSFRDKSLASSSKDAPNSARDDKSRTLNLCNSTDRLLQDMASLGFSDGSFESFDSFNAKGSSCDGFHGDSNRATRTTTTMTASKASTRDDSKRLDKEESEMLDFLMDDSNF